MINFNKCWFNSINKDSVQIMIKMNQRQVSKLKYNWSLFNYLRGIIQFMELREDKNRYLIFSRGIYNEDDKKKVQNELFYNY
ncbi:unnamed protein product [Paramecium sonneborni]|uniref:Uncharacterized protein n=1 Tax=Paramecium sonneborni TaxID=65129 RepID=A0A8S1R670_9CILI|nr:unnamed protein product [Paramecium sonneborni]